MARFGWREHCAARSPDANSGTNATYRRPFNRWPVSRRGSDYRQRLPRFHQELPGPVGPGRVPLHLDGCETVPPRPEVEGTGIRGSEAGVDQIPVEADDAFDERHGVFAPLHLQALDVEMDQVRDVFQKEERIVLEGHAVLPLLPAGIELPRLHADAVIETTAVRASLEQVLPEGVRGALEAVIGRHPAFSEVRVALVRMDQDLDPDVDLLFPGG